MKNRPQYSIASVDNALHLAQLLLLEGPLRVSEAAARLDVSVSTAHRLLAMLVYRDFAEQASDRTYRAGPMLGGAPAPDVSVGDLRAVALPHLRRLVDRVQESANLVVLSGPQVRFVHTVECAQLIRAGDRSGKALPAHVSSAGKAILAMLEPDDLAVALAGLDATQRQRVRRGLGVVRRNGFALNNQQTEAGLSAIGVPVRCGGGRFAGISVAMPAFRFSRDRVAPLVEELVTCARALEDDVREAGGDRQQ
ncbi:IclR family transcriptional regulator [Nocardioides sp. 31GB23]|uniref:DNA-binding IclR family transcriptional regulator n=1 Tax=Nocardioides salarius TaxID=374513 RepID=A0ABS2M9I9_9ACTN|nr:IclR family transcriptional regulator [Nocardioides salarius]MBM7507853.1 DNA-binding IclR family transcriptional regulator [Nocardioides salarius]